jgi:hypothetical protein
MHRTIMTAVMFCFIFFAHEAWAGQYQQCPGSAGGDRGLYLCWVDAISTKADTSARPKGAAFTPEKIKSDLAGRSVGPEALVKVKSDASGNTGTGPYDVYVPVPMGFVFDQTNILDVLILDVKTSSDKATLVVDVETGSSYAGKLRLQYEYIADEWILGQIENLSFKAR